MSTELSCKTTAGGEQGFKKVPFIPKPKLFHNGFVMTACFQTPHPEHTGCVELI